MKWKQPIPDRNQPSAGKYSDWKPQISVDCGGQCIYCAISEARYGGLDNFHVEHYRPKSKFVDLTNRIENLFLACAICNRFKSDDWPCEPVEDHTLAAYPDPSKVDYNQIFEIDPTDRIILGRYVAAAYVAERLFLNRPQLILERRLSAISAAIADFENFVCDAISHLVAHPDESTAKFLMGELAVCMADLSTAYRSLMDTKPYEQYEIRRSETKGS